MNRSANSSRDSSAKRFLPKAHSLEHSTSPPVPHMIPMQHLQLSHPPIDPFPISSSLPIGHRLSVCAALTDDSPSEESMEAAQDLMGMQLRTRLRLCLRSRSLHLTPGPPGPYHPAWYACHRASVALPTSFSNSSNSSIFCSNRHTPSPPSLLRSHTDGPVTSRPLSEYLPSGLDANSDWSSCSAGAIKRFCDIRGGSQSRNRSPIGIPGEPARCGARSGGRSPISSEAVVRSDCKSVQANSGMLEGTDAKHSTHYHHRLSVSSSGSGMLSSSVVTGCPGASRSKLHPTSASAIRAGVSNTPESLFSSAIHRASSLGANDIRQCDVHRRPSSVSVSGSGPAYVVHATEDASGRHFPVAASSPAPGTSPAFSNSNAVVPSPFHPPVSAPHLLFMREHSLSSSSCRPDSSPSRHADGQVITASSGSIHVPGRMPVTTASVGFRNRPSGGLYKYYNYNAQASPSLASTYHPLCFGSHSTATNLLRMKRTSMGSSAPNLVSLWDRC
ncbi:unnamed protein product [Echinostoma caproni]|uniref:Non-specific serine/threonine protein kinase n=1 Tax=Echinostoma caproni TaxID=27848 RepID=A0A183AMU9_9TREM|nr:unnamed protein product [Echinostoma caproni]